MLINLKHLLLSLEWGFCRVVDWELLGGRAGGLLLLYIVILYVVICLQILFVSFKALYQYHYVNKL